MNKKIVVEFNYVIFTKKLVLSVYKYTRNIFLEIHA